MIMDEITCPYVKYFFSRSISNQRLRFGKPLKINLNSFIILMEWYLDRHYQSIHPKEAITIDQQTIDSLKIFNEWHPRYSVDNWNFRHLQAKSSKSRKKDRNRRIRIIEKGSNNQGLVPEYSNYALAHKISDFSKVADYSNKKHKAENKNARKISSLFDTDEYFGFYSFPYVSTGLEYDIFRSIGNILWSVMSNQNLSPERNIQNKSLRFESIFTFSTYATERWEKNWRLHYLKETEIPFIITNSSRKYKEKTRHETFPYLENSRYSVAGIENYIMSFNFGLEKPPLVLPGFGWETLIMDYYKEQYGEELWSLPDIINLETKTVRLWVNNE
jgi:hypothetical protein